MSTLRGPCRICLLPPMAGRQEPEADMWVGTGGCILKTEDCGRCSDAQMDRCVGSTFGRRHLSHGCVMASVGMSIEKQVDFLERKCSGWGVGPVTLFFWLKWDASLPQAGRQILCLHQNTCFQQQVGNSLQAKHKTRMKVWRALSGTTAQGLHAGEPGSAYRPYCPTGD